MAVMATISKNDIKISKRTQYANLLSVANCLHVHVWPRGMVFGLGTWSFGRNIYVDLYFIAFLVVATAQFASSLVSPSRIRFVCSFSLLKMAIFRLHALSLLLRLWGNERARENVE